MSFYICIAFIILIIYILFKPIESFNPFIGISTRKTRNMSYDLRGEAYFPQKSNLLFNNSELSYFI